MIEEFLRYIGYDIFNSKQDFENNYNDYCISEYPESYPVYVKCFGVDHDPQQPIFSEYEFEFVYPCEIDKFKKG